MFDVRIARPADARGIAEVHVRSWQESYANVFSPEHLKSNSLASREAQWSSTIRAVSPFSTDRMIFVAEEPRTRRIVGFIMVGENSEKEEFIDSEIHALYVLSEFHRRGVGTSLLRAGLGWLQAKCFRKAHVWTIRNRNSEKFLARFGGRLQNEVRAVEIGGTKVEKAHYRFDLLHWGVAGELKAMRWIVMVGALPAGVTAEFLTQMLGIRARLHGFGTPSEEFVTTLPSLLVLPLLWLMLTTKASPRSNLGVDSYEYWKLGGWVTLTMTYASQILIRTSAFSEYWDDDVLLFYYPALLILFWMITALYAYLMRLLFRRGLYE